MPRALLGLAMKPKRYQWHHVIELSARSKCSASAVQNRLDGRPCRRATAALVDAAARDLGLAHLLPQENAAA